MGGRRSKKGNGNFSKGSNKNADIATLKEMYLRIDSGNAYLEDIEKIREEIVRNPTGLMIVNIIEDEKTLLKLILNAKLIGSNAMYILGFINFSGKIYYFSDAYEDVKGLFRRDNVNKNMRVNGKYDGNMPIVRKLKDNISSLRIYNGEGTEAGGYGTIKEKLLMMAIVVSEALRFRIVRIEIAFLIHEGTTGSCNFALAQDYIKSWDHRGRYLERSDAFYIPGERGKIEEIEFTKLLSEKIPNSLEDVDDGTLYRRLKLGNSLVGKIISPETDSVFDNNLFFQAESLLLGCYINFIKKYSNLRKEGIPEGVIYSLYYLAVLYKKSNMKFKLEKCVVQAFRILKKDSSISERRKKKWRNRFEEL